MAELELVTSVHGAVSEEALAYAEGKVAQLGRLIDRPVLFARLDLALAPDPALERPAIAKASLDLSGRLVRAHVAAPTMELAADRLEARLRGALEALRGRAAAARRGRERVEPGRWREGTITRERPAWFPRPAEERRVVRRKSLAPGVMSPEEAVDEMELLDHDFLLFTDAATGLDAVVHRLEEGGYGLVSAAGDPRPAPSVDWISPSPAPAPEMDEAAAVGVLDETGVPFVFARDPATRRGRVVYRRYDGHYGVIAPADELGVVEWLDGGAPGAVA